MDKVQRLCIPDWVKEEGIVWVEYLVCGIAWWKVQAIVELEIQIGQWGWN